MLRVISGSPGELEPVFEAMLENATRICEAKLGNLALYDGNELRMAAFHGAPPALRRAATTQPDVPLARSALGRVVETKQMIHIADWPLPKSATQTPPSPSLRARAPSSAFRCSRTTS